MIKLAFLGRNPFLTALFAIGILALGTPGSFWIPQFINEIANSLSDLAFGEILFFLYYQAQSLKTTT